LYQYIKSEDDMVTKEKAAEEYAEAVESMDKSVDSDIPAIQRTNREEILSAWSEEQAKTIASDEGITLTDEHLHVVNTLRDFYLEHGEVSSGRNLTEMLDHAYAAQGGQKYLRELFPRGPVSQGMRIAGLPVPAHTDDSGFGVAR
jgi:TusE/DsrC/DsvC family sulfur relay protein